MINTNFQLELEKEGKKEKVNVVLQEISPFIVSDIFMNNLTDNNSNYKIGSVIKGLTDKVIVSPKNLDQRIEESDNAIMAITALFNEVKLFCSSPRRYVQLQKESQAKSQGLEHSNTESNANGN